MNELATEIQIEILTFSKIHFLGFLGAKKLTPTIKLISIFV